MDNLEQGLQSPQPAGTRMGEKRAIIADLIEKSAMYKRGPDYLELFDFIARMPHMAPFNGMLLHIQKPGLRFAATHADWLLKFGRNIKEAARPLLIMWPFGPVALVYDVLDTEGPELPADVASAFRALGNVTATELRGFYARVAAKGIVVQELEYGDGHAGHVKAVQCTAEIETRNGRKLHYEIRVNRAHNPNVKFATLSHELGHLFLGHLGEDENLRIKNRTGRGHATDELEAESVAYLVCNRRGVDSVSESYLRDFVTQDTQVDSLDVYAIAQAAGRVEELLRISAKQVVDVGPMVLPIQERR